MGVLTRVYRIEPKILDILVKDPEVHTELFTYKRTPEAHGLPADWKPPKFDFDKGWDDLLYVLGETGYVEAYSWLADFFPIEHPHRTLGYYDNYECGVIADKLEGASFEEIRDRGLELELEAYHRPRKLTEDDYSYLVGNIADLRQFFRTADESDEYVLLDTGG